MVPLLGITPLNGSVCYLTQLIMWTPLLQINETPSRLPVFHLNQIPSSEKKINDQSTNDSKQTSQCLENFRWPGLWSFPLFVDCIMLVRAVFINTSTHIPPCGIGTVESKSPLSHSLVSCVLFLLRILFLCLETFWLNYDLLTKWKYVRWGLGEWLSLNSTTKRLGQWLGLGTFYTPNDGAMFYQ